MPLRRALLLLPLAVACSAAPPRPDPRLDPSNPDAPESAPLAAPTPLAAPAPEKKAPAATAPADQPVIYACPMHPEVTSPTPGRCPKCGMALKPKPAPPGKGATP